MDLNTWPVEDLQLVWLSSCLGAPGGGMADDVTSLVVATLPHGGVGEQIVAIRLKQIR